MKRIIRKLTTIAFKAFNRELSVGVHTWIDPRAFVARGGPVRVGRSCSIRPGAMLLPAGGRISIGDRTTINHYVVLNGEGGIHIGNDVLIAAFVAMYAGSHNFARIDVPIRDQGMRTDGGITIEDDVWIGAHCVILDGVRIGTGSVIAAGAVVLANVEPFSVVGGVPARLIRRRDR